jgi:outer membrane protein assembly factor BamB
MKPSNDLLDHAVDLFPAPERSFDRLTHRRDRKRRNQRIAAAVVAMVLAILAIGGMARLFLTRSAPLPAGEVITPENVQDLTLQWQAPVGAASAPTVADGVVYVSSNTGGAGGALSAFAVDCGSGGEMCAPVWTADTGRVGDPVVGGDKVIVASTFVNIDTSPMTDDTARVEAFNLSCGAGGTQCDPSWVGPIDGPTVAGPLVIGDQVFVATAAGTLYAFPVDCVDQSGKCAPAWTHTIPSGRFAGSMVESGGVLYLATADCTAVGECSVRYLYSFSPQGTVLSTRSEPIGVGQLWVSEGVLFGGSGTGNSKSGPSVWALPLGCVAGDGVCEPLWLAGNNCCAVGTTADGMVFVDNQRSGMWAVPVDCSSAGGFCDAVWHSETPQWTDRTAGPTAADGLVYVHSGDSDVYAFPQRCQDPCEPVWTGSAPTAGHAAGGVSISGAQLFVGAEGLYVFGLSSTQ